MFSLCYYFSPSWSVECVGEGDGVKQPLLYCQPFCFGASYHPLHVSDLKNTNYSATGQENFEISIKSKVSKEQHLFLLVSSFEAYVPDSVADHYQSISIHARKILRSGMITPSHTLYRQGN